MPYALGVDLGTTYTAAAIRRGDRLEIADLGTRSASMPSVVYLRDDGTVLTGDAALRRGVTDPSRLSREFKRRMGDTTAILLGGVPWSVDGLMARLLQSVVATVTERQGEAPTSIAVAHPANWGPYKKDLLGQAVRRADLDRVTFITEPEAAAVHYATLERLEPGDTVAVYDLGGGTFDAAVLRKTAGGFQLVGEPEGIERLGGIDFDEAVFRHVLGSLGNTVNELDHDDPVVQSAVSRLRDECVAAKEALSSDTEVTIPVILPNVHTDVRLTRTEFEAMIRPALGDTLVVLQRALRSAGVAPDGLHSVLLVGGSSRIPLISQLVSAELGRPVALDVHPKHSVALGAAAFAGGNVNTARPVDTGTAARPVVVAPPQAPPQASTTSGGAAGATGAAGAVVLGSVSAGAGTPARPSDATGPQGTPRIPPPPVFPNVPDLPTPTPAPTSRPTQPAQTQPAPTQPAPTARPVDPRSAAGAAPTPPPLTPTPGPAPRSPLTPGPGATPPPFTTTPHGATPHGAEGRSNWTPAPTGGSASGPSRPPAVTVRPDGEDEGDRPRRGLLVAVGVLVVAALAIGGAMWFGRGDDEAAGDGGSVTTAAGAGDTTGVTEPTEQTEQTEPTGDTEATAPDSTAGQTTAPPRTTLPPIAVKPACQNIPATEPCVALTAVRIVDGRVQVTWKAVNFPSAPNVEGGLHAHLYWSTFTADQVSSDLPTDEQAPWEISDQAVHTGATTLIMDNRPPDATAVCGTVGDANHKAYNPEIFHCLPLPAPPG